MREGPSSRDSEDEPASKGRRAFIGGAAAFLGTMALPAQAQQAERIPPIRDFRDNLAAILSAVRRPDTQDFFQHASIEEIGEWAVTNQPISSELLLRGTSYDYASIMNRSVVITSRSGALSVSNIREGDIGALIAIEVEGASFGNGVLLENGEVMTAGHVAPMMTSRHSGNVKGLLLSAHHDLARVKYEGDIRGVQKSRIPSKLKNSDVIGQWVAGSFQRIHTVGKREVLRKDVGGIAVPMTPAILDHVARYAPENFKPYLRFLPESLCVLVSGKQVTEIWDKALSVNAVPLSGISGGGMNVQRLMTDPRAQRYEYCGNAWAVASLAVKGKQYGLLFFHGPDQVNSFLKVPFRN